MKPQRLVISERWFLLYPLCIAATALGVFAAWDYVSDPIPIHYNGAFEADSFLSKEPLSLLPLLLIQCGLSLVFIGTHFYAKRLSAPYMKFPAGMTAEGQRASRLNLSRYAISVEVFSVIWCGVLGILMMTQTLNAPTFIVLLFLFIFVIFRGIILILKKDTELVRKTKMQA